MNTQLQYLLPKRGFSVLAGHLADRKLGFATRWAVRRFARRYQVDMSEAVHADLGSYARFNDFFTRALRPGVRPLADADYVCPVDGAISQFGDIDGDQVLQAKGHRYSVLSFLAGDEALAQQFQDGQFATLYLSPRDYHRVHMPCAGRLQRMVHVPGELFSVNPATARSIPGLFARNERVLCVFDTATGPMVLGLVGATIVGSVATVWAGRLRRPGRTGPKHWDYGGQDIHLARGAEMGRFLLGSTVVLLWPRASLHFAADWAPAVAIRMGQAMGQRASEAKATRSEQSPDAQ